MTLPLPQDPPLLSSGRFSTAWTRFFQTVGAGASGTVTSVSVTPANGISGTVGTAATTPAITLALGNITPTSVASSGPVTGTNLSGTNTGDQSISITGDVTAAASAGVLTATVTKVNGVSLAGLLTGILKNTTGTGAPSIAVAADFPTLNQNTSGSAASLTTARLIDGQSFNGTADITVIAPGTVAATGKTTPVDADVMPLADSAASNVLKKVTWANIKATLKTYFDTLYPSGSGTSSGANTGDQFTATTASRLIGRTSASAGAAQEITLGTNLSMSGTTLNATGGGGTGDVVGPASSVDSRVVMFNGVTGKLIKDSGLTLSGSNTGDQTITLTSDVTGSGTGSFATTIAAGAVTLAKMANLAANSILGNNTGSAATPVALTAAQTKTLLAIAPADLTGLGAGVATFLATPNSANLATAITDEVGTAGNLVFSNGPTIDKPIITTTIYFSVTAPASLAAAATLTAAQLLAGLIQYTGAAAALTLPTGTLMDAAITAPVITSDRGFEFSVINTGSGAATMTAGVGFTIVGTAAVTNGTSATFRVRKTAANTFVAYRL